MAAQKVGITPRPIRYGPRNWHVSSSAALESELHIRATYQRGLQTSHVLARVLFFFVTLQLKGGGGCNVVQLVVYF